MAETCIIIIFFNLKCQQPSPTPSSFAFHSLCLLKKAPYQKINASFPLLDPMLWGTSLTWMGTKKPQKNKNNHKNLSIFNVSIMSSNTHCLIQNEETNLKWHNKDKRRSILNLKIRQYKWMSPSHGTYEIHCIDPIESVDLWDFANFVWSFSDKTNQIEVV